MNKGQKEPENAERIPVVDSELCDSDRRFLQSLRRFIDEGKTYLQCPDGGASELRYIIYRSAFNKVIGQAAANQRLLLAIKAEYDDIIRELKRREDEAAAERRQSPDRIPVLQNQTAEPKEETRIQNSPTQNRPVPGLTVAQSEHPAVLVVPPEDSWTQSEVLLDRKNRCGSVEVQTELDSEQHRDLRVQNILLRTRYRRLKLVCDALRRWEQTGPPVPPVPPVPLEDLLGSTIQNIQSIRPESLQDEEEDSCWPELPEDEEPSGADQSRLLADHLARFLELFRCARYEAAALQAARCPGVLRSADTLQMFTGVQGPPGSAPPALCFFRALLVATATGSRLSGELSLRGVGCALQHGDVALVAHAVTQNKLTFCEALGDALTEHAQKDPGVADLCLALAAVVHQACGLHLKAALSMCRRGLVHGAAELLRRQQVPAEDAMRVLSLSPSLLLLQLLTEAHGGQAAILPVGGACASMLADSEQRQVALQLLDGFLSRGTLQDAILEDVGSSVDVWDQVASLCSHLSRADLSRPVRRVLLGQSGTGLRGSDPEGARLMEHVFL
ncbi:clathrin heavy chain linker domain-containing protein 1 [Fundulus heteroclitus]|uniref:clathrin heavy chain linker domain-containing protein 1 n=1 Tax=Fundulus heteroclitus TaxID=8078 RepID=UPI00165B088B|nr:clathrin heavy chain linker domain-containing protein 1 [Fundulus heteroclitus]